MRSKSFYYYLLFGFLLSLGIPSISIAQNGACEVQEGLPTRNGTGILGLTYSATECGLDFVTASQLTTTRYTGLTGSGFPFDLTINGIPSTAIIEQTFAWWGGSFTLGDPRIVVNSDTITGISIGTGPDKCWGQSGTENFRADITPYINANGTYSINCLEGEYGVDGITVMVIFRDTVANYSGTLIIEDGCIVNNSGASVNDTFDIVLPPICQPTNGSVFCIVSDMQLVSNPTHNININGNNNIFNNEFWNYSLAPAYFSMSQANFPMTLSPGAGDCYNWIATGSYFRNISTINCDTSLICPQVICLGDSLLMNGIAGPVGSTYLWTSTTDILSDSTSQGIYALPIAQFAEYTCTTTFPDTTTQDTTITIISNTPPVLNVISQDEICGGGNNGAITIGVNGFSPFQYFINGSSVAGPNNLAMNDGTYTVSVIDFYGCTEDTIVTITPGPPDFAHSLILSDTIVCKDTIFASVTTIPAANYDYLWSQTFTNTNPTDSITAFDSLSNGNNSIILTVAHPLGCIHTDTLNLVYSDMQVSSFTASPDTNVCLYDTVLLGIPFTYDNLICGKSTVPCLSSPLTITGSSGSISSNINSPFLTGKSDARFQMLVLASELTAAGFVEGNIRGIYFTLPTLSSSQLLKNFSIKIGCTSLTALTTFEPLTNIVYDANRFISTGSNYFDFIYDYAWDGTSNLIIETCFDNDTASVNNSILHSTTSFNSVITDTSNTISGCNLTGGILSTSRPNFQLSICQNDFRDIGNNYFNYQWSPAASIIDTTNYYAFVYPTVDTWYYVDVYDSYGACFSGTDSIFVTIKALTEGFFSYPIDTICANTGATALPDSTTTTPGFFSSNFPANLDTITGLFTPDTSLYADLVYIYYTPVAECPDVDTFQIDVRGIVPTVIYASENLCPDDPNAMPVYVYPTGGVFSSTETGMVDPITGNINFNAVPIGDYYTITYTLTEYTCITDTTELLFLSQNCEPFIFNGFTPNNDGINDFWYIEGIDKGQNTVSIFNRWGDLVWSGINYDNVNVIWRGDNSSGNALPSGTYYYSIEFDGRNYGGYIELNY